MAQTRCVPVAKVLEKIDWPALKKEIYSGRVRAFCRRGGILVRLNPVWLDYTVGFEQHGEPLPEGASFEDRLKQTPITSDSPTDGALWFEGRRGSPPDMPRLVADIEIDETTSGLEDTEIRLSEIEQEFRAFMESEKEKWGRYLGRIPSSKDGGMTMGYEKWLRDKNVAREIGRQWVKKHRLHNNRGPSISAAGMPK